MLVNETVADGLKREFEITVPAAEIEEKLTGRLAELGKTVRMPGFRPGKVPVSLLRKVHGRAVMGEVLERAIGDSSQSTITERGLRIADQPKIEITKYEEGADLEYKMAIELFPEIEPVDFKTLQLERMKAPADEHQIDHTLEHMAESFKQSETVTEDRGCATGDIAVIDFVGSLDGEEFPGGKTEGYQLELGGGTFIPGFEDQLIGAKTGEHREFDVTFPDNYQAEDLKGKAVHFAVDIKELRTSKPAEIDDELAKKMGLESLEQLRERLREEQQREIAQISRMHLKRKLLDRLDKAHQFPIPDGLVERELESIWKQYDERRKQNPDAVDEDDKSKSDDELKAEYREIAERRVRLGLLLSEIGRLNNIEVTPEETNRAMMNQVRQYPGQERQILDTIKDNPEVLGALQAQALEEKVVDYIIELATVTEKEVSLEELLKDPEAEKAAEDSHEKPNNAAAKKKPKTAAKGKEGEARATKDTKEKDA
jgi:trigger factor